MLCARNLLRNRDMLLGRLKSAEERVDGTVTLGVAQVTSTVSPANGKKIMFAIIDLYAALKSLRTLQPQVDQLRKVSTYCVAFFGRQFRSLLAISSVYRLQYAYSALGSLYLAGQLSMCIEWLFCRNWNHSIKSLRVSLLQRRWKRITRLR